MGLDITAYSRLSYVGDHTDGEWCEDEKHVTAYAYDSFPLSLRGIEVVTTQVMGGSSFLWGGCYAQTDETQMVGFRAGSYGGYGQWREDLARQFNPAPLIHGLRPSMTQPDPELPFYELIWFADNEGTIGELAAVELLADFRHNASAYQIPTDDYGAYYRQKYDEWTHACELAADGGLISFH